jgi:signal peptidase I
MSTTKKTSLPPLTPQSEPKKNFDNWRSILSTVGLLLGAVVIAFSITSFVLQSYQVDGQSMETTLQDNDRLIVDKWPRTWSRITGHNYVPKRGQIIIFNEQIDPPPAPPKQLIKRVIGLPGERVVVGDEHITVYNQDHPKGFNPDKLGIYNIRPVPTEGMVDVTLKKDQIFVCGDNRPNSEDSRFFGPIELKQVVGKLSFRIIPLSKAKHF